MEKYRLLNHRKNESSYLTLYATKKMPLHVSQKSIGDPWDWRLTYKQNVVSHCKFWKEPLRGTKVLLCGHDLKLFSSLWRTNSKTKHHLPSFFRLNTPKGIVKDPSLDLLGLNTQKDTKTAFLAPKRYEEHGSPPGPTLYTVSYPISGHFWQNCNILPQNSWNLATM